VKRRKRKPRSNLWVRKTKPKFIVSKPDGDSIWSYKGQEIVTGKTKGVGRAEIFYDNEDYEFIGAATEQEGLGRAKRKIDWIEYRDSLPDKKERELSVVVAVLWDVYNRASMSRDVSKPVTRAELSRLFERERDRSLSPGAYFTFDKMSLKDRLSLLDDILIDIETNRRFKKARAKHRKNPRRQVNKNSRPQLARQRQVAAAFLRSV